jgi:hypothetical protein
MKIGSEFLSFVDRQNLNDESRQVLVESTKKILSRTKLLGETVEKNCQLVVGEVQSGKTMSFTALTALAHENGFPLVIVLAGTKDQLLSQTAERLKRDLKADGNGGPNPWLMLVKPKKRDRDMNVKYLHRSLSVWNQTDAPPEFKPTAVISILKNRTSIDEVSEIVSALNQLMKLNEYPVLIIDDEGDQAGLNLKWATDEESTIYAAIGRLRHNLVRHSYVMYTATPQGPLLINIQDTLAPKFVTLLKSGADYLGGEDLFVTDSDFIMEIPESENSIVFDSSTNASPPESLKSSLAYYLIALCLAQKRSNPKPISMLIHPSAKKSLHAAYENWVTNILGSWEMILRNNSELTFTNLVEKYFIPAEIEIKKTVELPRDWNLTEVLQNLPWWIKSIEVRIINTDKNDIDPREWMSRPGWILIGGNKLERGFTIENLAVTYMPRSTGVGNVDVIQQRGRFFGYKRKYKDLLRGWFFDDHIQAYISYVEHEKSIRNQLGTIDQNGQELSEWRRRFLLDPAYQPVRSQIISLNINHKRLSLFKQHQLFDPTLPNQAELFLNKVYSLVSNEIKFPEDKRADRTHYYSPINFQQGLELLADWPMSPENRVELDDMIWALQSLQPVDQPPNTIIALMDWDKDLRIQHVRDRSMLKKTADRTKSPANQLIANIFQGPDLPNFPGDSAITFPDTMTIQVHKVRPFYEKTPKSVVAALGLILPRNTKGFIFENQER